MTRNSTIILFLLISQLSFSQVRIGKIKTDTVHNVPIDTVSGATISLFAKNKYEVINGLDIGLIANKADVTSGLTLGLIYNRLDRFNGVLIGSIANIINYGLPSKGFMLSSIINITWAQRFHGISLTGGINYFAYRNTPYNSTKGFIFAGLANKINAHNTTGFVLSGIYNSLGNHLTGIAISALGNKVGVTKGLLLGAINNTNILKGCTIGLYNKDIGANGAKFGLINVTKHYSSSGFSASLLTNHNIDWSLSDGGIFRCSGLYITGGVNLFNQFSGFAISGIGNLTEDFNGVALTAGVNLMARGKGVVFAGLLNYIDEDFKGLSIGLINIGQSTYQFGLVNISTSARVQVGLINFNKKSKVKVLPLINIGRKDNETTSP